MLKIFQFGSHFGVPDPSMFVLKLITYARLAGLEHEVVRGDIRKAPKGKMPWLEDNGKTIADSQFAIEYLKQAYGDPLAEGLDDQTKARHHMTRLAIENHTYFFGVAYRWLKPKGANKIKEVFFGPMGLPGKLIFKMVRKKLRRDIKGHGLLNHSWDEIAALGTKDILALESLLGGDEFFGGELPREIDATAFGLIANTIVPDFDSPLREAARGSEILVAYHNRMTERVFPDYKETMLYKRAT